MHATPTATRRSLARRAGRRADRPTPWLTGLASTDAWPPEQHGFDEPPTAPWAKPHAGTSA